jgi:hypothetical protein
VGCGGVSLKPMLMTGWIGAERLSTSCSESAKPMFTAGELASNANSAHRARPTSTAMDMEVERVPLCVRWERPGRLRSLAKPLPSMSPERADGVGGGDARRKWWPSVVAGGGRR